MTCRSIRLAHDPIAGNTLLHELRDTRERMRAVPGIDLPAGKAVELKPDGYMVMLMGLKHQIKEGDIIPISLVVEGKNKKRETIKLNASAMTMDAAASGKHSHTHTQGHEQPAGQEHDHAHTK
jgi:periplasmic copper chaperone A